MLVKSSSPLFENPTIGDCVVMTNKKLNKYGFDIL